MRIEKHPIGYLSAELEVEGYQDSAYTAVLITTNGGKEVLGRGTAKRSPEDKNRPEIAQELALGRAMEVAGKRLIKRANGLVRHQDYVVAEKQRRLEAQAAPKRRTRKTK